MSENKLIRLEERFKEIADIDYRTNGQIRAKEVRLIVEEEGEDGRPVSRNVGVVNIRKALMMAQDMGVDLVEVAPNANPPVCKVMDFGKFQYEQQKKEKRAKKNQKKIDVKEVQLRPKTDDHHVGILTKRARNWLGDGKKVLFKMRFRGREITHSEIGRDQLKSIEEDLKDVGVVEQGPSMQGRDMIMIMAPAADN